MSNKLPIPLIIVLLIITTTATQSKNLHEITIRYPNLYPESFTWDPISAHFIVSSLRYQNLISVSDAGVTSLLLSSTNLPPRSSFLGLALDPRRNHRRLLAVVRRSDPEFNALVAYDLRTFKQIFLTQLDDLLPSSTFVNDVAADYLGNAYITDSANNVIYKVDESGAASILSESNSLKLAEEMDNKVGLNGVVYNAKGYLLVVQSNTGKMFRVYVDDGTARRVILNREVTAADGMALRKDGVVLVVSKSKLYFVKSDDNWSEGIVFDETALEVEKGGSAVTVGGEDRAYVLYGHIDEGVKGNLDNSERELFSIVEVVSKKESADENVWIFVLLGLGLAYFMFWRFQMGQLVKNMNRKTA